MTSPEQTPTPQTTLSEQDPVIPPALLLSLSGLGFLVALLVYLFNGGVNALVFAGLGIGIICAIFWVLMNPDDARDALTGRSVSFGGTAVIVLILVLIASGLVYAAVQSQNWSADLSDRGVYSLDESIANAVENIGADPTVPSVELVAFYGTLAGGERDRVDVLLNEIETASDGKITYRFVDPERQPQVAQRYGAQQNGQIAIVPLDTQTGEPRIESADIITYNAQNPAQFQRSIVEGVLTSTTSGDFRAYFVTTEGGVDIAAATPGGAQVFVEELRNTYGWTVESVSLLNLTDDNPSVNLTDAAADGIVLVLPGGSQAINDELLPVVTDYLDAGGNVVIFGGRNLEGGVPLGTGDALSAYLSENYGISMRNDYIFDQENSTQFGTLVGNFGQHPITNVVQPNQLLVTDLPHSIEIAETPPETVTVSRLAFTGQNAYAKDDLDFSREITNADIQPDGDDLSGELVVAAAADNSETGGQVVMFGTEALLYNQYRQLSADIVNQAVARQALFWTVDYESFVGALANLPQTVNPADRPFILSPSEATTINTVSLFVLPFGMLALGVLVWWQRRETAPVK